MRLHAVLVTFNCTDDVRGNLRSVLESVERIWIYDNSTDLRSQTIVQDERDRAAGKILLHSDGVNVGLAKAQNWGLAEALLAGADAVLLLDQDSRFSDRALDDYVALVAEASRDETAPTVYCPNIVDKNTDQRGTFVFRASGRPRLAPLKSKAEKNLLLCMASGMIIPASVLREVGLMNRSFFIDALDTEYCLRVIAEGGQIVGFRDVVLAHQLGDREPRRFLFWDVNITQHSARRLFTIFRNRIRILVQFRLLRTDYIIYDLMVSLFIVFKVIFLERDRVTKSVALVRGTLAGLGGQRMIR